MAITLAKLCRDTERKYNMKLIAGSAGMNNTVRWVHMVEDMEVPSFLHGNELIFTTGIGHISNDRLLEFVGNLKKYNAVGIVLNLGPYIREAPEEVVSFCEREGFPLFVLPWDIYIIDITYDFCRRIIENEKSETSAIEAFRSIIAYPGEIKNYMATLDRLGFSIMNRYRVMLISFFQRDKNLTEQLERNNKMKLWSMTARSRYPSVMFLMNGQLVVIRQNDAEGAEGQIAENIEKSLAALDVEYVMGISGTERGYNTIAALYDEAEAAYKTALFSGEKIMHYSDIGINKLLFGVKNKDILKKFVSEHIGAICTYDKKNGTDYGKILRQYLESDSSVKTVADANNVHRNTVNGRIKQIKEIFSLELTNEQKINIMLAFHIKDIIDYI